MPVTHGVAGSSPVQTARKRESPSETKDFLFCKIDAYLFLKKKTFITPGDIDKSAQKSYTNHKLDKCGSQKTDK